MAAIASAFFTIASACKSKMQGMCTTGTSPLVEDAPTCLMEAMSTSLPSKETAPRP